MFETLTRAISTALFFICAAVMTEIAGTANIGDIPTVAQVSEASDEYSLIGMWNSNGKVFEFTPSGELIYDDIAFEYVQDGNSVIIKGEVNGKIREYTLKLEPVSSRVARLNGIKMYRIK